MVVDVLTPPPTPLHDERRLQALKRWQGGWSAAEHERAQALMSACAQALGTPVANLGLVDGQQWLPLAAHPPLPALPTCPKAHTPCAYTVLQPEVPWQVHDLARDTRWASSPWLQHRGWRAYAGVAVRDADGLALGTLAVFDTQPRLFNEAEVQLLLSLAPAAAAIAEAGALRATLAQNSVTDTLTGLSNRAFFCQTLELELGHAMRTGEPFTVLNMDLDGFRAVKDGFGHAAGEAVLVEVSQRLLRCVRQGDVVARFSGDEFGVVMRHGGKESAQVLAKRIVKAVSAPITLASGDEIGVGISVGMAAYTDAIHSVVTLLQHADQALFQAKQQNEKRWKMFVGIR